MNEQFSLTFDKEQSLIQVGGELSFVTVKKVLSESNGLFESAKYLNIDLAAVTRSDSAGIALLIDWMRTAKSTNKQIAFHNIPAQMLAIASASGLDEILASH